MPRADLSASDWDRCFSCKANKHGDCEHHINDGAVDAEDFIMTRCNCPCRGEVPEGGKLIDLVADLRDLVAHREYKFNKAKAEAIRYRDAFNNLKNNMAKMFDDEGNLTTWLDQQAPQGMEAEYHG